MSRFVHRVAFLLAAGLLIGLAHSYLAPIQLRPSNNPEPGPASAEPVSGQLPGGVDHTPTPTPKPQDPKPPAEAVAPNYFITVERAKELWEKGKRDGSVYFVDARNQEQYVAGHVAGAMNILPGAFSRTPPKTDYLVGMTVVVYCVGQECTDSEAVMIGLQNLKRGIKPIYIMHDGYGAWAAKGYPVERGPDPLGP
jgi:rhodanese-related sulfurtransferase